MSEIVPRILLVIALPIAVFLGGTFVMSRLTGRGRVVERLERMAGPADRPPLGQRLHYDAGAAHRHWGALDDVTRAAEERFLELDLVFPFFYGGALVVSLLIAWATLGRPFHPAWLVGPVAGAVGSDWVENLVQLAQLRRYARGGAHALQDGWMAVASAATLVKLAGVALASLGLLVLVAVIALQGGGPR